jgi:CysZ protein
VNVLLYLVVVSALVLLLAQLDVQLAWDFWGSFGARLSDVLSFLLGTLRWLVGIPLILIGAYLTFTSVGMVVASPFNDVYSEKIERAICEPDAGPPVSTWTSLHTTAISLWDSARIAGWQLLASAAALLLVWVPVAGPLVWFTIGAWFSGRAFVDVAMARNHLRPVHKRPLLLDRRWQIFGLGVTMQLLFMIPFAGLLVLPLGVGAGTLLYCDYDWPQGLARRGVAPPKAFRVPQLRRP